jgi:hypothetical protein
MQRQMTLHRILALGSAPVALALGIAACSADSTGPGTSNSSQLEFRTTSAVNASSSQVPVTNGGHTLDLTGITLTVSRAELKRAQSDVCPGDDDENDDRPTTTTSTASCGELRIGRTTIELPLTGSPVTLPANTIPFGTYREFELRLSSVELKGTFDTKAFDVTIPISARSEIEFSTPLVVADGAPAVITVNVPTAGWLVNTDGSLIDPNSVLATPSLLAQIGARIGASFRAFEDRDHDGSDDHGSKSGHGGN